MRELLDNKFYMKQSKKTDSVRFTYLSSASNTLLKT